MATSQKHHRDSDHSGNSLSSPIVLILPAETGLIRLARLMASGVAASIGCPPEDVGDLRIAVDEVCTGLVEAAEDSSITLTFTFVDECFVVTGHAASSAPLDETRLSLSRLILDGVADEHDISDGDGIVRFRVARHLDVPA